MISPRAPRLLGRLARHVAQRDSSPLLGATYLEATRRFWSGYFSFDGRASRSEYWWQRVTDTAVVMLAVWLVPLATGIPNDPHATYQNVPGFLGIGQSIFGLSFGGVDGFGHHQHFTAFLGGPPTQWVLLVWFLTTAIPNLALGFRRLRDHGSPGWLAILGGFPLIDLALLLMALFPSGPTDAAAEPAPEIRARARTP